MASKVWHDSCRASFSPPHSRREKEALLRAGWALPCCQASFLLQKIEIWKFAETKKPDVDSWTEVKRRKPPSTKTDASNKVSMWEQVHYLEQGVMSPLLQKQVKVKAVLELRVMEKMKWPELACVSSTQFHHTKVLTNSSMKSFLVG